MKLTMLYSLNLLGLIILSSVPSVLFAEEIVPEVLEEALPEEEIDVEINLETYNNIELLESTSTLPEILLEEIEYLKEDHVIISPTVSKIYKREKVEPVKAPSHAFMRKPDKSFPDLKPTKGESIQKPSLSAKALYRLYGIVEATTTEPVATSTIAEDQPVLLDDTSDEPETISSSTSSSTLPVIETMDRTSTQSLVEIVNGTSTPSGEATEEIAPQTFIKPEEVPEITEEANLD